MLLNISKGKHESTYVARLDYTNYLSSFSCGIQQVAICYWPGHMTNGDFGNNLESSDLFLAIAAAGKVLFYKNVWYPRSV